MKMIKISIIKTVNTKSKLPVNSAGEGGIHREFLGVFILFYFVI